MEIGVGKANKKPQTLSDICPDGYHDRTLKSVTSKHTGQYRTKYDKNCNAIGRPQERRTKKVRRLEGRTKNTDEADEEDVPQIDIFNLE